MKKEIEYDKNKMIQEYRRQEAIENRQKEAVKLLKNSYKY